MKITCEKFLCVLLFGLVGACAAIAQEAQSTGDLDSRIQSLKQQALELNRDLAILEQDLLFPTDSRLTVYLSADVGEFLSLDAVKLSIDGTQVTDYLYTQQQFAALRQGGVHRLYMGNLKSGDHEMVAEFVGKDTKGGDYRREARLAINKTTGAKNVELKISDPADTQRPEFTAREW
jgi:hypothetical protein